MPNHASPEADRHLSGEQWMLIKSLMSISKALVRLIRKRCHHLEIS
jgi:hypothetical protein